ncbi:hypothetical protein NE865_02477 [Phthorimaea operculella]|nr:hypothetical protein NE865_02477 [Phthorimaea operculella]
MKISKYKTVSLEHVKKLQTQNDRPVPKVLPQTNVPAAADKSRRVSRTYFTNNRFKLIKNNTGTKARRAEFKTPIKRRSLNSSKIMLGSSQKLKMRVDITKFKKNNIPCPLFRKYGTCLRNSRGKCEFLHDKKHVSICRKFLKGVCHDKNCLLSHEVTAEKMPTCSFYLNGMCTREDCPYLHVKLNEKTKICLDFLKGYCEKGNECLNRHINLCPDQAIKGSCLRKKCPYPHRNNKKTVNKVNTKKINVKSRINIKVEKKENIDGGTSVQSSDKVEDDKDCRYYKEVVEDTAPMEVEVIKPTRCKLGALPSFIQL